MKKIKIAARSLNKYINSELTANIEMMQNQKHTTAQKANPTE